MITEFVFDNIRNGEGIPKEKIIKQNAKLIKFTKTMVGKFYTLLKNKVYEIIDCDNIKMIILEQKELNGYKIIKGIQFGDDITIYNKEVRIDEIKKIIVVEQNGVYSHGDTVERAIKDFRYKISSRDLSKYEYLKKEKSTVPTDELIKAYRVITGACEFGTKTFVEQMGVIENGYTVPAVLKLLKSKNAWGIETFEKFVRGAK